VRGGSAAVRGKPLLSIFLTILILFAAGCVKDPVTGKSTYNWFSLKTDVKLGEDVMKQQLKALKKKKKAIDKAADPAMYKTMREVAFDIAAISHIREFPWEFHLAEVDVVNAWAAPGGKIMVYSGLYEHEKEALVNPKRVDEMAAVLGHEIAHATARHVTESISRNYSILIVGNVALSAVSASGSTTATNIFHDVFVSGMNIFVPSYTRKNESEADKIGLFYMARAGYDPSAARDLWYRACKKRGDRFSIYASHPSSCSRAKDLEKYLPEANELYRRVKAGEKVEAPPHIP
jgi:predicted Zn-dependent protease